MDADYYNILGVSHDATTKQIIKAYKKLALKYHPDRNLNNEEEATLQFKQISEAAEILRDTQKRKMYDTYGADKTRHLIPQNWEDLFDIIFNDNATDNVTNKVIIHTKVEVALKHCYYGNKKDIPFTYLYCASCLSFGEDIKKCLVCEGEGKCYTILQQIKKQKCEECKGKGYKCVNCTKYNVNKRNGNIAIQIPIGARNGQIITRAYDDYIESKGTIKGNILVAVVCKNDAEYEVKQNDLYRKKPIPISLKNAVLGSNFLVNHFHEQLLVKSSLNMLQNNKYYKIAKKGLGFNGDLFVKFEVNMCDIQLTDSNIKTICAQLPEQKFDENKGEPIEITIATENDKTNCTISLDIFNYYSCKHCNTCIASKHDMPENGILMGKGQYIFEAVFNVNFVECKVLCRKCKSVLGQSDNKCGTYCLYRDSLISPISAEDSNIITQVELELSLRECYKGTSKNKSFEYQHQCILNDDKAHCSDCCGHGITLTKVQKICEYCNGSSRQWQTKTKKCSQCKGSGKQKYFKSNLLHTHKWKSHAKIECTLCFGAGEIPFDKCRVCQGKSKFQTEEYRECESCDGTGLKDIYTFDHCNECVDCNGKLKASERIDIAAGVNDGDSILISSESIEGKQLLIKIKCKSDETTENGYERKENDLYMIKPVPISLCNVLMGQCLFQHFQETLLLSNVNGIIENNKYNVLGKGMKTPINNGEFVGNLFVKFEIRMPRKNQLDEKQIKTILDILPSDRQEHNNEFKSVELQEVDAWDFIDENLINEDNNKENVECKTM